MELASSSGETQIQENVEAPVPLRREQEHGLPFASLKLIKVHSGQTESPLPFIKGPVGGHDLAAAPAGLKADFRHGGFKNGTRLVASHDS